MLIHAYDHMILLIHGTTAYYLIANIYIMEDLTKGAYT